jgi:hypothetical protein
MFIDPKTLVPKLPKPQDLQPFPQVLAMRYSGHKGDCAVCSDRLALISVSSAAFVFCHWQLFCQTRPGSSDGVYCKLVK